MKDEDQRTQENNLPRCPCDICSYETNHRFWSDFPLLFLQDADTLAAMTFDLDNNLFLVNSMYVSALHEIPSWTVYWDRFEHVKEDILLSASFSKSERGHRIGTGDLRGV